METLVTWRSLTVVCVGVRQFFWAPFHYYCPFVLGVAVLKSGLPLGLRGIFWLEVWLLLALRSASHFFLTSVYKRMVAWASWTYDTYMQACTYTKHIIDTKETSTQSPQYSDGWFVLHYKHLCLSSKIKRR